MLGKCPLAISLKILREMQIGLVPRIVYEDIRRRLSERRTTGTHLLSEGHIVARCKKRYFYWCQASQRFRLPYCSSSFSSWLFSCRPWWQAEIGRTLHQLALASLIKRDPTSLATRPTRTQEETSYANNNKLYLIFLDYY